MALKKIKTIKGYDAEYWKMTRVGFDLMTLTLSSQLDVFKDMATRQAGSINSMGREVKKWGIMDLPLNGETIEERFAEVAGKTFLEIVSLAYTKWVESDIQSRQQVIDGVPQVDEQGRPIMEDYEANWFADSESVLEV